MAKKSFTTRLDEEVLALAQRIAEVERRSVTNVLEVAVVSYAETKNISLEKDSPRKPEPR